MRLFSCPHFLPWARACVALVALACSARTALADEPCAATSRDLLAAVEHAESAYASLDVDGFVAAVEQAERVFPCLIEPITRDVAAGAHRMVGLRAFIAGDRDRARLAFAAARALEPGWRFPESLFPPGHPVRTLYEDLPLTEATWIPLPPSSAIVRVDGRTTDARPASWPALVQVFGPDGSVLASAYLWPEDPLPALPTAGLPVVQVPTLAHEPARRRVPWGWMTAAALSAGGAGALYWSAWETKQAYETVPYAGRDTLQQRANGLVLASGGLGVVALGSATMAVVSVRW